MYLEGLAGEAKGLRGLVWFDMRMETEHMGDNPNAAGFLGGLPHAVSMRLGSRRLEQRRWFVW